MALETIVAAPTYIAVDGHVVHVIKRCTDRACDRYHQWVTLGTNSTYREAREIANAMNEQERSR